MLLNRDTAPAIDAERLCETTPMPLDAAEIVRESERESPWLWFAVPTLLAVTLAACELWPMGFAR